MKTNHFPELDKVALEKIIELAEQRESADAGRYPVGITLGQTPLLPPTEAEQALKSAIDNLSLDDAQEFQALMYIGRDGLEGESLVDVIKFQREQAAARTEKDIKRSLYEKVPLASYLRDGLRLAQDSE